MFEILLWSLMLLIVLSVTLTIGCFIAYIWTGDDFYGKMFITNLLISCVGLFFTSEL